MGKPTGQMQELTQKYLDDYRVRCQHSYGTNPYGRVKAYADGFMMFLSTSIS